MGWLFRKSIKILPGIRVNLGKRGFTSVSVGPRGAKVNVGKKGTFLTTGIPGTGLSHRQKIASGATSEGHVSANELFWYCPKCYLPRRPHELFCSCGQAKVLQGRAVAADNRRNAAIVGAIIGGIGLFGLALYCTPYNSGRLNNKAPVAFVAASPQPSTAPTIASKSKGKKPLKAVTVPANTVATDYSRPETSSSSRYIRGPRGGCYYINGNGNKT